MKTKRFYVGLGAFAGVVAALVLANQASIRNANAQQTTDKAAVDVDRDAPVDTARSNQLRTNETRKYGRGDAARAADHTMHGQAMKASEIIGMNVRGKSGDDSIGSISDLMIRKNGHVDFAAVSFGGFLGIGDKLFAVPFEAIEFVKTDDESYARIDVSEETLKQKQGFDQDHWPQQPDKSFLTHGRSVRQAERR